MKGVLASLYRYPVKGFTPEPLAEAELRVGEGLAFDRVFAVENGPSGFDLAAPAHVTKMRFAVLATLPEIARVRTRYDEAAHVLRAEARGMAAFAGDLNVAAGQRAFEIWLTAYLGGAINGLLRAFAPPRHRFFDDPDGHISLINLASLRDLEARIGRRIDPLRFRANFYIEGWPAWAEMAAVGRQVTFGNLKARVVRIIPRCIATHVDPIAGVRDIEMLDALRREFGHVLCGVYLQIETPGRVRARDAFEAAA